MEKGGTLGTVALFWVIMRIKGGINKSKNVNNNKINRNLDKIQKTQQHCIEIKLIMRAKNK